MNKIEIEIENKIKELTSKSLTVNELSNLMNVLRENYYIIDKRLYLYCKVCNVSFLDSLIEILENNGFKNIDKGTISVYWNRVKKERAK